MQNRAACLHVLQHVKAHTCPFIFTATLIDGNEDVLRRQQGEKAPSLKNDMRQHILIVLKICCQQESLAGGSLEVNQERVIP